MIICSRASEVATVAEQDVQPDPSNGRTGEAGYDAVEDGPGWLQVLGLKAELGHRVTVEDVDVAAAVYQDSGEASSSLVRGKGGVQNQGI